MRIRPNLGANYNKNVFEEGCMNEALRSRMQFVSPRKISDYFRPTSYGAVAVVLLAVFLLVHGAPAAAQSGATGTIVGTVTDTSGAVVPGAAVSIINVGTNVHQNTVSSG